MQMSYGYMGSQRNFFCATGKGMLRYGARLEAVRELPEISMHPKAPPGEIAHDEFRDDLFKPPSEKSFPKRRV